MDVAQIGGIPESNKVGTVIFSSTALARLDIIGETFPGLLHILVGFMAFYHAVASLMQAFTGHQLAPLGPAFLYRTMPALK